jgi:pyridoxal phosphate enzyme (YggS family)
MADERGRQVADRLAAVREQVAGAATAAGRSPDDVCMVVVTKTWPSSDTRTLHALGVRDVGENRQQDIERKVAELADLDDLTWHFIGQIQSNKAAKIAASSDVVHSVDSVKVARRLGDGAQRYGRVLDCFIQVSLDPEPARSGRGGVTGTDLEAVAEAVASAPALRLVGVMGVAPLQGDAEAAYSDLAVASTRLRALHPAATAVSAGMSADFSLAIRAGATHVRVGSAVLGERPSLR